MSPVSVYLDKAVGWSVETKKEGEEQGEELREARVERRLGNQGRQTGHGHRDWMDDDNRLEFSRADSRILSNPQEDTHKTFPPR